MIDRSMAASLLAVIAGTAIQAGAAADRTIDELPNIEDMALTSDGRWVIASSMSHEASPGALYVIGVKARTIKKVPLAAASGTQRCPAGFDPAHFMPHGIDRVGNEIYAVNHGGRQSVEHFHIKMTSGSPAIKWADCVVLPEDAVGNGVAALPDGTLFVTNNGPRSLVRIEGGVLHGKGDLLSWSGGSWHVLPGTERPAWNGIVVSRDGKHLYVAQTFDRKVFDYTLGSGAPPRTLDLSFMPDNLRLSKDGNTLWVAGQATDLAVEFKCFQDHLAMCGLKSGFGRIDRKTLTPTCLTEVDPQPKFDSATVAVPVGNELWIGTMKGESILTTRTCAPGARNNQG